MKFKHNPLNSLKLAITSILLSSLLSGCFYMNIDGSNDFDRMVNSMIESSYRKLKLNLEKDEVVLVSDFVSLDNLENKSKLGFLLSETLKDVLSNQNIIVREVELGRDFTIGDHGFNVLSRNDKRIDNQIYNERFAVVGTYSITDKRLRIFVKLIDIYTGHILSSSSSSTVMNEEIKKLDFIPKKNVNNIYQPMVL